MNELMIDLVANRTRNFSLNISRHYTMLVNKLMPRAKLQSSKLILEFKIMITNNENPVYMQTITYCIT